jgi:hypothetical protein
LGFFLSVVIAPQQPASAQYLKPVSPAPDDLARYNLASTDARRRLFAAAMSSLTPEQLKTFWVVYADYEREKDAIAMARTDLAKKYLDMYIDEGGPEASDLAQIVDDAGELQKKNTDLRLKYFRIYSQKLNPRAAARFALIDDYETTAIRLDLFHKLPLPANVAGQ